MHERFLKLGMQVKAEVVAAQIRRLEAPASDVSFHLTWCVRKKLDAKVQHHNQQTADWPWRRAGA